ncbi:unnamed protein product [Bursaphelenchus okinawaensis]|uniref:SOSS complex subunit A homolog n=1 Tax=Bursaphelenchus okinawaensis TaxID=465554 RepID=A0A811JUS3_9BILA|nr:unnamed protein product [Bursaphelenchus okinawaensis]CAG9084569.1 unnamed protein product [Bursaphelenchus okinawaensis]
MSRPPIRPHGHYGTPRPLMDRQMERYPPQTVCRLLQLDNHKLDRLDDANKLLQFEDSYLQLQAIVTKVPDINMGEYLSKNPKGIDMVGKGSIVGFLCEPAEANKYFNYLSVAAKGDNWQEILTSINKVILDGFCLLKPLVRLRFIDLMEYLVLENVPCCDCALFNLFRETNSGGKCGDANHMLEIAELQAELMIRQRDWFARNTFSSPLSAIIFITFSRILAELPPSREKLQQLLCAALDILLHDRFRDLSWNGREQVLLMLRVSKVPYFRNYWKILLHNPKLLGLETLPKFMSVKPTSNAVQYRVSYRIQNVIENLLQYKPELIDKYYFEWFNREFLSSFDAGALRMDVIRYVVTNRLYNIEHLRASRVMFLIKLMNHCKTALEFQLAKQALIFDWICTDISEVNSGSAAQTLDLLITILKHCFNNTALCPLGNSLVDLLLRTVLEFQPMLSNVFLSNLSNSIRCVQTIQPGCLKIFDHPRIDRTTRTALSTLLPEFFGKIPEPQTPKAEETRKRKSPEEEESTPAKVKKPEPLATSPTTVAKGLADEAKKRTQSKLKEAGEQLNGELKKRFDLMMNITLRNGIDSEEAFKSAKTFFTRLRSLKVTDEQIDALADCLIEYWEPFLVDKRFLKRCRANMNNVIYTFMENWTATRGKKPGRQTFMVLVNRLSIKSPVFDILVLIYGLETEEHMELYQELAEANKCTVPDQFVKDMPICSVEDPDTAQLVLTKIESFPELHGSVQLVEVMCNYITEAELYILNKTLSLNPDGLKLFDQKTFHKLIKRSLAWSPNAQWLLWNLIRIEGIEDDWITSILYLINDKTDPVASMNILTYIEFADLEIDVELVKDVFFRPVNDGLTVTFLRSIFQTDKQTSTMAEQTTKIMTRLMNSDRISKPDESISHKAEARFGTVANVLKHLEKIKKAGNEDSVYSNFVKADSFGRFYEKMSMKPGFTDLAEEYSGLFSIWKKLNPGKQVQKKNKEQKELRRKRTVDYVELSDDDED